MAKRPVIIELSRTKQLESEALNAMTTNKTSLASAAVPRIEGLEYDENFPVVAMPKLIEHEYPESELYDSTANLDFDDNLETSTFLVRGTVEENTISQVEAAAQKSKSPVKIYADRELQPMIVCPGSPAVGTDTDVENLLCVKKMHRNRMNGSGVLVAIVDTGVNMAYLNSQGKTPTFDASRSWAWDPASVTPGSAPVGHGTMVAFDVCISAPDCTILDIALLHPFVPTPTGFGAFLSDAIRAYRHLLSVMNAPRRPGEHRSLVVNNSWGMFHSSWDFPVGHPGNYSDNLNHPFSRIVATLERAGADILFAAGNCGADCPDGRCQGVTTKTIWGANSHPAVTCVAGVDTTKARVGYSAIGPGRLEQRKPDISGYTHFAGSGVYTADGGTSAACPVVSGVVAAIRTRRPYNASDSQTSPAALRNLLTQTAEDLGPTGYDFQHGHGVVNGCKIVDKIVPPVIDICERYPWICSHLELCRRYPWLCRWDLIRDLGSPLGTSSNPSSSTLESDIAVWGQEIQQRPDVRELLSRVMPESLEQDLTLDQLAFLKGYLAGKENTRTEEQTQTHPCKCTGT
ncbi:MAG: hypothetical protein NPIRA02_32330 [Nitrospirales bacterium]|nr:MAG: hypothetical protein NPIRA02_32330 [Nitrospirales bacterium]